MNSEDKLCPKLLCENRCLTFFLVFLGFRISILLNKVMNSSAFLFHQRRSNELLHVFLPLIDSEMSFTEDVDFPKIQLVEHYNVSDIFQCQSNST